MKARSSDYPEREGRESWKTHTHIYTHPGWVSSVTLLHGFLIFLFCFFLSLTAFAVVNRAVANWATGCSGCWELSLLMAAARALQGPSKELVWLLDGGRQPRWWEGGVDAERSEVREPLSACQPFQWHFQRSLSSFPWLILVNGGQGILFWVLREGQEAAGYISLLVGGWRKKSIIKAGLNTDDVLWPSLQLLHHSYVFLPKPHWEEASETKRWSWSQFLFLACGWPWQVTLSRSLTPPEVDYIGFQLMARNSYEIDKLRF